MKKNIVIGVILSYLVAVMAGGGYIWFHHTLKKSLPWISGVVNLQGLKEDVEIINAEEYLAILKVVNWGLSKGWHADLTAAEILEKVGEEKLRKAFPVWPDDASLIIPEETKTLEKVSELTSKTIRVREKLAIFSCPAVSIIQPGWIVTILKHIVREPWF